MRQKNWTTTELRTGSTLWKEGKSINEIAEALGRKRESVKHKTQSDRQSFPRRKQASGDLKDVVEIKLIVSVFAYQQIKAEAKARGISINMIVRETFLHRFVRKTWKLPESTSIAKVKYSRGSKV